MLRYCDDDSAFRSKCLLHLAQNRLVIADVLKYVEGTDDVELLSIGYVASIHLQQLCLLDPGCRERKAATKHVAANKDSLGVGLGLGDTGQDLASAAADLKVPAHVRKMSA